MFDQDLLKEKIMDYMIDNAHSNASMSRELGMHAITFTNFISGGRATQTKTLAIITRFFRDIENKKKVPVE